MPPRVRTQMFNTPVRKHENAIALVRQVRNARIELDRLMQYLQSPKFHNEDYVYIRTDLMPKLIQLHRALRED